MFRSVAFFCCCVAVQSLFVSPLFALIGCSFLIFAGLVCCSMRWNVILSSVSLWNSSLFLAVEIFAGKKKYWRRWTWNQCSTVIAFIDSRLPRILAVLFHKSASLCGTGVQKIRWKLSCVWLCFCMALIMRIIHTQYLMVSLSFIQRHKRKHSQTLSRCSFGFLCVYMCGSFNTMYRMNACDVKWALWKLS